MSTPPFDITKPLQLNLLGLTYHGNPFHSAGEWSQKNEIGLLWQRFISIFQNYSFLLEKLTDTPRTSYELHYEPANFAQKDNLDIFVGMNQTREGEIPLDLVLKPLPEVRYLSFTSPLADRSNLEYFFRNWLQNKEGGYQQAYPFVIQLYDERFKGMGEPTSVIEWMIPVVAR